MSDDTPSPLNNVITIDDEPPGLSFLPGDIKYESPGGNVRVYFPIVTSQSQGRVKTRR